ncbi:uncharacterized protein LOC117290424 isoform X2 [Asterias rubens]|uniref:uncharacterized protein LOC117290424 isoform X2 n=1 Tax=Asterias rubens TaxID=7604 RepID=UPI0014558F98|nr:uncharacterized protein LOC117290424 isoform X2 [Asterias rubens]
MFGRKKKKTQAQPQAGEAPVGTPPVGNPPVTPQKTKKANKKKQKDSFKSNESPVSSTSSKRRGFFGRKSKAPTTPYNDASSAASISSQQSIDLNYTKITPPLSFGPPQPQPNGNVRSPGFPMSPSSSITTGSIKGSNQENQSFGGRGYEERELEFWDEVEVLTWLTDQGFDYFVELFDGCEIDGEYLMNVTEEDLVDLEVDDEMLRRQFLDAVRTAQNKSNSLIRPTLDQQLSVLSLTSRLAGGDDAPDGINNTSKASAVKLDLKESPRSKSPPPRLVLKKHSPETDNDSESEFAFDSDDLGSPLGDLPDNSNAKTFPVDSNSYPRSPVDKSSRSGQKVRSPRSPVDKSWSSIEEADSPRSPVDKSRRNSQKVHSPRSPVDRSWSSIEEANSPRSPVDKSRRNGQKVHSPRSPVDKSPAASKFYMDTPHNKTNKKPSSLFENDQESPASATPSSKSHVDGIRSPGRDSNRKLGSSRSRSQSVVTLWTEGDVAAWLEDVQLTHLKSHFIEHEVTGKQLLNIDMQLLDVMEINDENDRELLLAKLYELNNPTANVPEMDLISAVNRTSGYEHKKYLAAMKVLQSSDSEEVQLLPPETLALPDSFSSTSRTPSTASDQGRKDEKKKKGGLSKLKGVISPKRRESRDFNLVHVWTDIMRSGNTTVSLRLTETETVRDLIKLSLDKLGTIEDWRLYCILDSPGSEHKDKGFDREMDEIECPVIVQQTWPERNPRHYELRQKPAQGGSIKIVLRLDNEKPKGKLLAISLSTPAKEVIPLGLLKFGLTRADPKAFCLLEVDKAGDLQDVEDEAIPLQSDSHAFVLCAVASKDSQLALSDGDGETEDFSVRRNDSTSSRGSSKVSFSGVSFGSSAGSDLLSSYRIDDEKLSKLELEMATIEESLNTKSSSKQSVQDSGPLSPLSAPQISTSKAAVISQSDTKQKDATIEALRQENKLLQEKTKQLALMQKALSQLEQTYKRNEADSRQRVHDKRELAIKSGEALPKAVIDSQRRLKQLGEEIDHKKLIVLKMQQQQKQIQGRTSNSAESRMQEVELEYRLAQEETSMVTLQQQQAGVLAQLEVALVDHQAVALRNKTKTQALFKHLHADERYMVYTVGQTKGKHGWDFSLAADQSVRGAVIQRCTKDSGLNIGDRLVELNGENVTSTSPSEINHTLSSQAKLQMVLLREGAGKEERGELDRLQQRLDTTQSVNDRLQEDIQRLKDFESQAKRATQLQSTVQKLQTQLSEAEMRAVELEHQLRDDDEQDQSMQQIRDDRHKLQMEVIKLKETICRLENTLDAKTNQLAVVRQERDSIAEQLMMTETNAKQTPSSHHLVNEALEDGLPLWEALKSSSKTEILEVLQEELEEAGRQKEYLDQLYTLMLERAPDLLEDLEVDFDASELSDNEEFC